MEVKYFPGPPLWKDCEVRSEKELSLQALAGLQQVTKLFLLWTGWLLQNTYLVDGIKFGEEVRHLKN